MSDMYWQFGYSGYSTGRNHNDGFTIYLNDAEAQPLVYKHAAAVNALNGGGSTSTSRPVLSSITRSVSTSTVSVTSTTRLATLTTRTSTSQPPPTSMSTGEPQVRWCQCGGNNWNGPTKCESP